MLVVSHAQHRAEAGALQWQRPWHKIEPGSTLMLTLSVDSPNFFDYQLDKQLFFEYWSAMHSLNTLAKVRSARQAT
jgi:hypothetical protein